MYHPHGELQTFPAPAQQPPVYYALITKCRHWQQQFLGSTVCKTLFSPSPALSLKIAQSPADTHLVEMPLAKKFLSTTRCSEGIASKDRWYPNVWQKFQLSLLLGVSVAFWYCKQLTQAWKNSVSETVYTKEFHLSVCLQFTCEKAKIFKRKTPGGKTFIYIYVYIYTHTNI